MGLFISGLRSRIIHEAKCPRIAPPQCAEEEIPEHIHDQTLNFFQLNFNVNRQLPMGFQLEGSIPIDLKNSGIEYRLLENGDAYEPPYAGIHHRNETLFGLGDGHIGIVYFYRKDNWVFGAGSGVTIPLGKTEEDPYALANDGKAHQHFQMGSGIFSPRFNASVIYNNMRWGLLNTAMAQITPYENSKGYSPGNKYRLNTGPWYVHTPRIRSLLSVSALYEEPDEWFGSQSPNSGKKALGLSAAVMWRYRPDLELSLRIERNLFQSVINVDDAYQNDQVPPAVLFSFGVNHWR